MSLEEVLADLVQLLQSPRPDVKQSAVTALAQLSGSPEGSTLVANSQTLLKQVCGLVAPGASNALLLPALNALINVSALPSGARAVVACKGVLLGPLLELITSPTSRLADKASGLLVNLTRDTACSESLLYAIDTEAFYKLFTAATVTTHNQAGCHLHCLTGVLENFTQLDMGRRLILNQKRIVLQNLLPFARFPDSEERRRATVATIHNCCFSKDSHSWLLSPAVDLASHLCLCLSGPSNYSDEETEGLSDMLVFLDESQKIEPEADIRALILQSLMQLCSSKSGREELRRQNVYYVLRELHVFEKERALLLLLEDLVNLLIRTEEEIGADDLSSLSVSDDMKEKFHREDREFLDNDTDEKKIEFAA